MSLSGWRDSLTLSNFFLTCGIVSSFFHFCLPSRKDAFISLHDALPISVYADNSSAKSALTSTIRGPNCPKRVERSSLFKKQTRLNSSLLVGSKAGFRLHENRPVFSKKKLSQPPSPMNWDEFERVA